MIVSFILLTLFCYVKSGVISADDLNTAVGAFNDAGLTLTSGNATTLPELLKVDKENKDAFETGAYVMTGLTVLIALIVAALFTRIRRAVRILELASAAIRSNCGMLLLPFFSGIFLLLATAFWFLSSAYVATAGDFSLAIPGTDFVLNSSTTIVEVAHFEPISTMGLMLAFLALGLLWNLEFVHGCSTITVGGAVGAWYWLDKDANPRARRPVLTAIKDCVRYHLGQSNQAHGCARQPLCWLGGLTTRPPQEASPLAHCSWRSSSSCGG